MTTPDHARVTEWDAAYVLGALSPAERRDYEEHLEDCDRCRAAVAELMALPGLLGRIDDARAFALLEAEPAEDAGDAGPAPADPQPSTTDLVARIRAAERSRRIRRILVSTAGLAAAAALATVLTLAIPPLLSPTPMPDAVASFSSASGEAIDVDMFVKLTSADWGTRLEMDCYYHPTGDADGGYGAAEYSLWVVGTDGSERSVSTWTSTPGGEVVLDAATATPIDEISQLDLRSVDGEVVLMSGAIAPIDEAP
jgi:hypothetical protein